MEVFASIQGEGAHVGEPQVFLRLFGCPLRCAWCDTPGSWAVPDEPVNPSRERPSAWLRPFEAMTRISRLDPAVRRAVSLTGGEPLMWPGFLIELRPLLGERRLHLETAGAHPESLRRVIDAVDHVSLDLKLFEDMHEPRWQSAELPPDVEPSDEPAPRTRAEWAEARALCLALVRGRDACAKIVLAGGRELSQVTPLLDDLAAVAPELPLVLQPVTPIGDVEAPTAQEIEVVLEAALARRLSVRVLPQVHRALRLP